ncbi:MAG TPA: diacylglycerol kinase family protein, partial [Pricia sp.]|nr:diacylglycerol kinase family protein [Pricia sp.]
MKTAQVIHNPSAGNAAHSKDEIMEIVRKAGYTAEYISMEDRTDWENFDSDKVDAIFLAGGDGTVHKLAKVLLEKTNDKSC